MFLFTVICHGSDLPITPLRTALAFMLIMSLTAYLLHLKQLISSLSVLSDMVLFYLFFFNLASVCSNIF